MLALNDVQRQILADIRGLDEPDLPYTADELEELELMYGVCEDTEIADEIRSILVHADE